MSPTLHNDSHCCKPDKNLELTCLSQTLTQVAGVSTTLRHIFVVNTLLRLFGNNGPFLKLLNKEFGKVAVQASDCGTALSPRTRTDPESLVCGNT